MSKLVLDRWKCVFYGYNFGGLFEFGVKFSVKLKVGGDQKCNFFKKSKVKALENHNVLIELCARI
ncbi:hypothetical protein K2173_015630 [Erythroxylum novogranatense]|uniref:Uncharacterized protein n=1 Tax=Erythroxylum novogranatense TaxID=1862640 RepID=A0AAV8SEM3_9ROSI|nr:hypothetical protein K2173_015630 [Erythroxylum novogranatense]